jgi:hypothetical protein
MKREWWWIEKLKFLLVSTKVMKSQKLKPLELIVPTPISHPLPKDQCVYTEKAFSFVTFCVFLFL